MKHATLGVSAVLVLAIAGCAAPTQDCVNHDDGYAIEYPAAWHVNTVEMLGPCALFDPEPIDVPRDSQVPIEIAIRIGVEPMSFDELTGEVVGRRTLARQVMEIAGRPAMRIDGETTGEGLHAPGIHSYQYFVDLGDRTLVAGTHDVGPVDFEQKREVLNAMVASMTLE